MSGSSSKSDAVDVGSLEWLRLRQEINENENRAPQGWEKLKQKIVENPFVPLGAIGTTLAVILGLKNMMQGNQKMSQLAMRMRVGCQAFAVGALVIGLEIKRRQAVAEHAEEQAALQVESSTESAPKQIAS